MIPHRLTAACRQTRRWRRPMRSPPASNCRARPHRQPGRPAARSAGGRRGRGRKAADLAETLYRAIRSRWETSHCRRTTRRRSRQSARSSGGRLGGLRCKTTAPGAAVRVTELRQSRPMYRQGRGVKTDVARPGRSFEGVREGDGLGCAELGRPTSTTTGRGATRPAPPSSRRSRATRAKGTAATPSCSSVRSG